MSDRDEAERLRAPAPVDERGSWLRRRLQYAAVHPFAMAQRGFNASLLRIFDALSHRVDVAERRADAAERRAAELEERLLRLERRPGATAPDTVAPQPRAKAVPDYFAFEARMRGSADEVRERQRPYVERLRGHPPVLDLGCGRGELLALLRDAGVEARGADASADMVAFARGEGLEVDQASAHDALAACSDASLGAVTALQVLEHLPPADIVSLLRLAHAKLRPGGVLIVETIDPSTPAALRNYFADLTHAQPLVPETLELLVRGAGFRETETISLNDSLDYAIVAVA
ncbi:MAG TPA: class I SAM-dependent methyltransferase [Gaiellaceae bacterium]|nr:class I SAM-dependent methyltransferase [Gaiellaceae bacterium]